MWRCHVPFILLPPPKLVLFFFFFFVEQKGNINKTITYIQSKTSQTAERDDSLTTILLPYTD